MKQAFIKKRFNASSLIVINQANDIITEYVAQGYSLTLRQLYYQFVSRDIIPNNKRSYHRIVNILSDARLAGLVSWTAIEDRTRNLVGLTTWDSPAQIVESCIYGYRIDKWEDQPYHLEVWVEKEALTGIVSKVCNQNQVNYIACRGYMSQSEQYNAGRRLREYAMSGITPIVIHLGDHDPSGIDMTRDNVDRLDLLSGSLGIQVNRIALNMDQVRKYNPPPNPAKLTDSRCEGYIKKFGRESWELDALEPAVIADLIQNEIDKYKDKDIWDEAIKKQEEERDQLRGLLDHL